MTMTNEDAKGGESPALPGEGVAAAADRVRKEREQPRRGPGRPKGSKSRKARPAALPVADGKAAGDQEPPRWAEEPTEAEIRACAMLGMVLWNLTMVRTGRFTELQETEVLELGRAMVPVQKKWAEWLGPWMPEVNLVVCFVGLAAVHQIEPPRREPDNVSEATVIGPDFKPE